LLLINIKNKSANKGAQLMPKGMPMDCLKTWSPNDYINIVYTLLQSNCVRYLSGVSQNICLVSQSPEICISGAVFVQKAIFHYLKKAQTLIF
jgi:hypothetical protein